MHSLLFCLLLIPIAISTVTAYATYQNEELLQLVIDNNPHAFTELYNRYWQKLFAIAYNRLQQRGLAEDVVHDVFAGLWANRQQLHIHQLENYLATATRYLVFSKIKKQQLHQRFLRSTTVQNIQAFQAENTIDFKRILERVNIASEKLPEKCKLIFKYSREQGMTIKEIAQMLHLSPKTVENQIGKALKHIKLATRNLVIYINCLMLLF